MHTPCFVIAIALIMVSHASHCQQVLSVQKIPGPREVEISGRVLRYGGTVAFVGRSGVWELDTLSDKWNSIYSAPVGSSILTSVEEPNGSLVFLDEKQAVWRCTPGASVERLAIVPLSAESYKLIAGEGDILVCGYYRVLGTIGTVRVSSVGVDKVNDVTLEMSGMANRALEFSDRCSSFVLSIEGLTSEQLSRRIYRRYVLMGKKWVELDENQSTARSFVDSKDYQACLLVDDSLYTTSSCPPSRTGAFVATTAPRSALARISDSTTALFTPYSDNAIDPTVFIVHASKSMVIDTITCPKGTVIFNVTALNDLIIVNCRDVVLIYREGSLFKRISWPATESSASFRNIICSREYALLFNGSGLPALYNGQSLTWSPIFAIRNSDTSRITVISDGVAQDSVMYLWNESYLYVSKESNSRMKYYDVLSLPRRIMHVRPLANGDALIAVSIPERDTVQPYWYVYSRATGEIAAFTTNWPRAIHGLEPVASVYDSQTATILIGTRTEWYGFQTDTSVFPIYGVLRLTKASSEWVMSNDGLGLSLRCFALQKDDAGTLFMTSAYSDGISNIQRPSLYLSTDLGDSWQSIAMPLPMDLGKRYALSVTSSGAYVHDQSCYRVITGEGAFEPVTFSNDQLGIIYAIRSGLDSTTMIILASTGLYKAQVPVTSTGVNAVSYESASVNDTQLTIRSAALNDNCYVRILGIGGQCLFEGRLRQLAIGLFSLTLDSELPPGVYFVITANQVIRLLHSR